MLGRLSARLAGSAKLVVNAEFKRLQDEALYITLMDMKDPPKVRMLIKQQMFECSEDQGCIVNQALRIQPKEIVITAIRVTEPAALEALKIIKKLKIKKIRIDCIDEETTAVFKEALESIFATPKAKEAVSDDDDESGHSSSKGKEIVDEDDETDEAVTFFESPLISHKIQTADIMEVMGEKLEDLAIKAAYANDKELLAFLLAPGRPYWLQEMGEKEQQVFQEWLKEFPLFYALESITQQLLVLEIVNGKQKEEMNQEDLMALQAALNQAVLGSRFFNISNELDNISRNGGYWSAQRRQPIDLPVRQTIPNCEIELVQHDKRVLHFLQTILLPRYDKILVECVTNINLDHTYAQNYHSIKNHLLQKRAELEAQIPIIRQNKTARSMELAPIRQLVEAQESIKQNAHRHFLENMDKLPAILQTHFQDKQSFALVDLQINPNIIEPAGNTLLHIAVINRHYELAQFLLAIGASPLIKNQAEFTPFKLAAELNDNGAMLKIFVDNFKQHFKYTFWELDKPIVSQDPLLTTWTKEINELFIHLNTYSESLVASMKLSFWKDFFSILGLVKRDKNQTDDTDESSVVSMKRSFVKEIFVTVKEILSILALLTRNKKHVDETEKCYEIVSTAGNAMDLTTLQQELLKMANEASHGPLGRSRLFEPLIKKLNILTNKIDRLALMRSTNKYYEELGKKKNSQEILQEKVKELEIENQQIKEETKKQLEEMKKEFLAQSKIKEAEAKIKETEAKREQDEMKKEVDEVKQMLRELLLKQTPVTVAMNEDKSQLSSSGFFSGSKTESAGQVTVIASPNTGLSQSCSLERKG